MPKARDPDSGALLGWMAFAACIALGAMAIGLGLGDAHPIDAAAGLIDLAPALGLAALAFAGAWGWGAALEACIGRGRCSGGVVRLLMGLGLLMSLWHGLGALGLLGAIWAWSALAPGLLMVVWDAGSRIKTAMGARGAVRINPPDARLWLLAPGAIALLAGLLVPFGLHWTSEFGAYDSLAYHLQLPREWSAMGAIRPVAHNIYSYLPGYLEASAAQMALLAPADPHDPAGARFGAMLAGNGWRIAIAPALHAGFAVLGAVAVGKLAARFGAIAGLGRARRAWAGWIASAVTLATPWVVVAGSMAYNEMAVVAFGAGAMLVAMDRSRGAVMRWALGAALVGFACCCKPTAIFMLAPGVGITLLAGTRRSAGVREFARGSGAGLLGGLVGGLIVGLMVGLITIGPWLVRNASAGGNPVFPAMTGVFGRAHWTGEQVERFARGHRADEPVMQRATLLVWPTLDASRGLTHTQWGIVGVGGLAGVGVMIAGRRSRSVGLTLGAIILAQIIAWVTLTHAQSRFLTPMLPALGAGLAIGALSLGARRGSGAGDGGGTCKPMTPIGFAAAIAVIAGQIGALAFVVVRTPGWGAIALPAHALTGESIRRAGGAVAPDDRATAMMGSVAIGVNLLAGDGEMVYLLGDARALLIRDPVLSNSTWDAWPIASAIASEPGDPDAWVRDLRRRGIDWIVIDYAEVARLVSRGRADPGVTPERIGRLVGALGEPALVWSDASGAPRASMHSLKEHE